MRSIIVPCALCVILLCGGCQKTPDETKLEQADLDARVAKSLSDEKRAEARQRQQDDIAKRLADLARAEDIRRETAQTFAKFNAERPNTIAIDEAKALEATVASVRKLMAEPDTMQVRNARFNSTRSAVCMEINYREDGKYRGFRQVYVTAIEIMVEPDRDHVSHRVFELSLNKVGCDQPAESAKSK